MAHKSAHNTISQSGCDIAFPGKLGHGERCSQTLKSSVPLGWIRNRSSQLLRSRENAPIARYGVSLVALIFCLLLRESLTPLIVDQDPFMFFAPAVLLSACVGGIGPGLFAWFAGLALGDYIFSGPRFAFGPYGPAQITLMSTYSFTSLTAIALIQALIHLKKKAQLYSQSLEQEMARRKDAEASLQHARDSLQSYAVTLEQNVQQRTIDLQETVDHLEGVLYHMAHDLRSPLRAMAGYSSLIQDHYQPKPGLEQEDWPARISQAAIRMDALIQDLLAYGKLGHAEFQCELTDLNQPLSEALAKLHSKIKETAAQIVIEKPLLHVWANSDGLREVFFHLLSNALKFTRPGTRPEIRIRTEIAHDRIRIWVEDKGIGFESQYEERIFRVFEKLRGADYEGHGIGLAVVRKVVSRMHGQVGALSEQGRGSRFWITLPRSAG
jgi:signal transduction histidine kinase